MRELYFSLGKIKMTKMVVTKCDVNKQEMPNVYKVFSHKNT